MPAFKKFGDDDQIDNVLILNPRYDLASGTLGWHGSPNGSSSLSLYGGMRRSGQHTFSDIRYQTIYPSPSGVGQITLGQPLTASIRKIYATSDTLTLTQRSDTRWGFEHWNTIQRLYQDYYKYDPDYVTSSYDYYSLFFQRDSSNTLVVQDPSRLYFPSGSWTAEAWVCPFSTSSISSDFTIFSWNGTFWIGITGSTGKLTFSSSVGSFTASSGPIVGSWSHVAIAYDSTIGSASFRINLNDCGKFSIGNLVKVNSFTASLCIGNTTELITSINTGKSFHGLIGENRLWTAYKTDQLLSSSWNRQLSGSELTNALYVFKLNEGPNYDFGQSLSIAVPNKGSGTLNIAAFKESSFKIDPSILPIVAYMNNFDTRVGPAWLPNDNMLFYPNKRLNDSPELFYSNYLNNYFISSGILEHDPVDDGLYVNARGLSIQNLNAYSVISIPSAFYGRQIVPNSVSMTCNSYSSGSWKLQRTIIDDGRGGLFISGSMMSGSSLSYRGVEWNKIGNVFYGEGLIVIKDQSLLDFGEISGAQALADTFQLTFKGDSRIPVKTLMCRIDRGEFNASLNSTFYNVDNTGLKSVKHPSSSLRISTIGVYNSDMELVGVARFADPIRLRSRDKMNIKLRMDF